jgi:kinesin family protein 11
MAEDETKAQSVRVVVRVRPMNERELKNNTLPVVTGSTDKREVTLIRGVGQRQIRQTYNFDSVFTSFSSQSEVFQTIHPLISEVMQGFEATVRSDARLYCRPLCACCLAGHVCSDRSPGDRPQVFAYGQTGTGKTHTMEGDLASEEFKGIIPRAVEVTATPWRVASLRASRARAQVSDRRRTA